MAFRGFFILIITAFTLSSCSVTRRMPEDQLLLTRNRLRIEKEENLSRSERAASQELAEYIRQRPNKRLFGIPFFLQIYNLSPVEKQNWTKRTGEAPVVYDPVLTARSVDALSIYMRGRGFFNSFVEARVDTLPGRKVRVEYRVRPGTPSRIGTVRYDFQDNFVAPIILEDSAHTLIRSGDIFSTEVLQQERQRITAKLKDQGFYNFSINNIIFPIDTVSDPGLVNIRNRVRQRVAGYGEDDEPVMENNRVYRIRNLYIQPDYDPNRAALDPRYYDRLDTAEYRGVYFIYDRELPVSSDVLLRAINIYPNYLYNAGDVSRAYDNLMKLNYFRSANILFTELPDSLSGNISFVGDEGAGNYTREGYLDCHIRCTPGMRQSYSVDLEGATTSSYYGLLTTLGYQNRNLFKGAESVDFSITAGYEFMRVPGRKNSIELGGAVGVTFPRFVSPVRIDRYNRLNNARTRAEVSYNYQDRPFYNRILTSAAFGYSWSNSRHSSFLVRPVDISVVKLNSIDQRFLDSMKNEYLKNSYRSQLISGISGSYIYNNQQQNVVKNTFRMRLNAETNGNLLNTIMPLFERKTEEMPHYKLFGIQYAQYVRSDLDMSYKFALGQKTALVSRFYVGGGMRTAIRPTRRFLSSVFFTPEAPTACAAGKPARLARGVSPHRKTPVIRRNWGISNSKPTSNSVFRSTNSCTGRSLVTWGTFGSRVPKAKTTLRKLISGSTDFTTSWD